MAEVEIEHLKGKVVNCEEENRALKDKVENYEEENRVLKSIIQIHGLHEFIEIGNLVQSNNKESNASSLVDDQMQTYCGHEKGIKVTENHQEYPHEGMATYM